MIKRRTALALMSAAVGSVAATSAIAQPKKSTGAAHALDLDDKAQLARAFRKLAYSLDDSVTFWWLRGERYGVVDSYATRFWDMYVGAWFRTRTVDADVYEVTMTGANFYTPPGSTELLEIFRNPYTGEEVPIKYAAPRARLITMGAESEPALGGLNMPGMKTTRRESPGPGWIEGDEVIIQGDMILNAVPLDPSSGARPFHVNDWSTYVGSVADIANPDVTNAPASQSFMDVLSWPQWLRMGDQPGSYVSRCYGRKVFAYDQMPATWRKLFAQALPDVAKDPLAVLNPGSTDA